MKYKDKKLNLNQKKYSVMEKELLAIMFTLKSLRNMILEVELTSLPIIKTLSIRQETTTTKPKDGGY